MLLASGKSRLLTLPLWSSVCFHRSPLKSLKPLQQLPLLADAGHAPAIPNNKKFRDIKTRVVASRCTGVAQSSFPVLQRITAQVCCILCWYVALSRNGCPNIWPWKKCKNTVSNHFLGVSHFGKKMGSANLADVSRAAYSKRILICAVSGSHNVAKYHAWFDQNGFVWK